MNFNQGEVVPLDLIREFWFLNSKMNFIQVEVVPLDLIRAVSGRAEALLSEKLNWETGMQVKREPKPEPVPEAEQQSEPQGDSW
jgi:hypothetical protein